MKDHLQSIHLKLQEYQPEIRRYGVALVIFCVCLSTGLYKAAGAVFVGTLIMLAATTWGERYRQIGEHYLADKKFGPQPKPPAGTKQQGIFDEAKESDRNNSSGH